MTLTEEQIKQNKNSYNKKYREKNESKEIRRKLEEKKIVCECGCEVRKYGLKQHLQTKKHTTNMNKIKLKAT